MQVSSEKGAERCSASPTRWPSRIVSQQAFVWQWGYSSSSAHWMSEAWGGWKFCFM